MEVQIYNGDCQEEIRRVRPNSIDAIITDPPYGLTSTAARASKGFMGKEWDGSGIEYNVEMWKKCLKVLKPGGYLLAFGGSRTYHRIACAIEDAGFEIRDCIMWLYGSGFPKNMNIGLAIDKKNGVESPVIGQNEQILKKQAKDLREGKRKIVDSFNNGAPGRNNGFNTVSADIRQAQNKWSGWGTALKPAYEPIIVARKPFNGSLVDNVIKYGVGGINIDECRVAFNGDMWKTQKSGRSSRAYQSEETTTAGGVCTANDLGRFPANIILDTEEGEEWRRYFYCAKASKKDRDEGLDSFEKDITDDGRNKPIDNPYLRGKTLRHNTHPTVKPTALMQYLIRLVTPEGGAVLDPFMGSGSTGKAVMFENRERSAGYKFIGIEKDPEYCEIAKARIEHAKEGQWKLV